MIVPDQTCSVQTALLCSKPHLPKPAAFRAAPAQTCCAQGCSCSKILRSGQLLVKPGLLKLAPTQSILFSRLLLLEPAALKTAPGNAAALRLNPRQTSCSPGCSLADLLRSRRESNQICCAQGRSWSNLLCSGLLLVKLAAFEAAPGQTCCPQGSS